MGILSPFQNVGVVAQTLSEDMACATTPSNTIEPTEPDPNASLATKNAPRFREGQLVGGRYEVLRFIARGGMGEVYEVFDHELGTHIALKTLLAERSKDARHFERFRREIALARRVHHPNVARVFDVGFHEDGRERFAFLTMDLLRGESLASYLASHGPLDTDKSLELVRQLVAGLAAAHDAGIIHRDFKTDNVLLVPDGSKHRAIIVDFGLARPMDPEEGMSLSRGMALLGSPPYMAPEQVEGQAMTAAVDIYALGVVLFEMVTGTLPFMGATPIATATMRLTAKPPSPRELAPTLPSSWEKAILRCLERNPLDRFGSVLDVVEALTAPATPPKGRRALRRALVVAAAAAVVSVGVVAIRPSLSSGVSTARLVETPSKERDRRRSVAVLGFRDENPEPARAWLSTAVTEAVAAELAATGDLRVVSTDRVAQAKLDIGVDPDNMSRADVLQKLRTNLNVDLLVVGSFARWGQGDAMKLNVIVKDAASLAIVAKSSASGRDGDLADISARADASLRSDLGLRALTSDQSMGLRASLPSSHVAPLFTEGLFEIRRHRHARSAELFKEVIARDPSFAMAHAYLTMALTQLGRDAEAGEAGARAVEASKTLPAEQRLWIEGRHAFATKDWNRAKRVYEALCTFFPDNVDYAMELAEVQTKSGHPHEAFSTIDAFRRLPPELADDPRVDLEEARAAHTSSDYPRCLAASARALARARAVTNGFITARAGYFNGIALLNLGRLEEARVVLAQARDDSERIGDITGVGLITGPLAQIDREAGRLRESRSGLATISGKLLDIGQRYYAASVREDEAFALVESGELGEARSILMDSIGVFRELNGKHALGGALPVLATIALRQGDLQGAEAACNESIAITESSGRKTVTAAALLVRSDLAQARGDDAKAIEDEGRALSLFQETKLLSGVANVHLRRGRRLRATGELQAAKAELEEALATQTRIGQLLRSQETKIALADVAIALQDYATAETLTDAAREALHTAGAAPSEARAVAQLAALRALRGETVEARQLADEALEIVHGIDDLDAALDVETKVASVWSRIGDVPRGRKLARDVADRAQRVGLARHRATAMTVLEGPRRDKAPAN